MKYLKVDWCCEKCDGEGKMPVGEKLLWCEECKGTGWIPVPWWRMVLHYSFGISPFKDGTQEVKG